MRIRSQDTMIEVTFDAPLGFQGASNPANYRLIPSPGAVPVTVTHVDVEYTVLSRGVGVILPRLGWAPPQAVGMTANSSMTATLSVGDEVSLQGNSSMVATASHNKSAVSQMNAGSEMTASVGFTGDKPSPVPGGLEYAVNADMAPDSFFTAELDQQSSVALSPIFLPYGGGLFAPGQYLSLSSDWNTVRAGIVGVAPSRMLTLSTDLVRADPENGRIPWEHHTGVVRVRLTVNKPTNAKDYTLSVSGLRSPAGLPFREAQSFSASSLLPSVVSAELLDDGQMVVTYTDPMRRDHALSDPNEYSVTGPTAVQVQRVSSISDTQMLLKTIGMADGAYTLTVNAAGTPHDVAGNPIDPDYNTASFTGNIPITTRSIFVDKGPITKPPLVVDSGATATVDGPTSITLPTALLGPSALGLSLTLTGSATNDGTYLVTAILSATQVRVRASLSLPDAANGAISWELFDPQDGVIADDPEDVTVLVNGSPVVPQAVIGLLGQIVLDAAPAPADDVAVDYCWICNPTVEFRSMNAKSFRFNNWNRDLGREVGRSQHRYRYNNSMVQPELYSTAGSRSVLGTAVFPNDVTLNDPTAQFLTSLPDAALVTITSGPNIGLRRGIIAVVDDFTLTLDAPLVSDVGGAYRVDPVDVQAELAQPRQRDLKYRAYERAYSVAFNDPNLLLFNSPTHRIAFPPLSRTVESVFVNYQAQYLPENDPVDPWEREGTGNASLVANELVIEDTTTGPFPGGEPLYWVRPDDLTFAYVFAAAWRMTLTNPSLPEGVWTGVAAGYADDKRAYILGYLLDGGVRKFGFLKKGFGNDPSSVDAWTGGIDGTDTSTFSPVEVDWNTIHSYRLLRDRDGVIRLYLDGSVVETLRILEEEAPRLSELNAPFDGLQNVFFGSLSRPAQNTSTWSFVRYTIQALNPLETAPSIFVSYEANEPPDEASQPWTPVGSHGTETVLSSDFLVLDSTSASDLATEAAAGLVSGDFRGFSRIEPLLGGSSDVSLDLDMSVRTFTHGLEPNAVMAAVDDGQYLTQLSFVSDTAAPKFSYGGRSLPENFSPYFWNRLGTAPAEMVGQLLRIDDTSVLDGAVYYLNDNALTSSPNRIIGNLNDYILEFRVLVHSYTVDGADYAGVMAQIYDSSRSVGIMFQDVGGTKNVTLHSDGIPIAGGQFAFDWDDAEPHTYRLRKDTGGNLVTLFIDAEMVGMVDYSDFAVPAASPVGQVSFGSSTPASVEAISQVDWYYCNTWRVLDTFKTFVGLWKGTDTTSLLDYHLPTKATGVDATVVTTALGDPSANFLADGVVSGDYLVVPSGSNKGVYVIDNVTGATSLTITTPFPVQPSTVDYNIPIQTDWTMPHKYRLLRDPGGGIGVFFDAQTDPIISVGYNSLDLPSSSVGVPRVVADGLPSITWGAFDTEGLSQTVWDFVRFGITRAQSELGIVPHHQVMNQRNIMASYEHHRTIIAHDHTNFWSESEGIPPQTEPDLLRNPDLTAYTLLNEGTPLVPSTQAYEVRRPTPTLVPNAAFNDPEDLLNNQGFTFNNGTSSIQLLVPDDVLYDCLKVIETTTGDVDLIAPFGDDCNPNIGTLNFTNTVCLEYDGSILPEDDLAAPTPWVLESEDPARVSTTAFAGILTYGTDGVGTKTIYRNATPLTDSVSLQREVNFRFKVLEDSSGGLADSQVRIGLSSLGLTLALAFITTPLGQRYVVVVDLNDQSVVGGLLFDYLDGLYHDYRLVLDPETAAVQIFIDN